MNDLYQSNYHTTIYTPIYLPVIVFYDEEESESPYSDEVAEA